METKYSLHKQFKGIVTNEDGDVMKPGDKWHFPAHRARDLVRRFVLVEVAEEIKPKSRIKRKHDAGNQQVKGD